MTKPKSARHHPDLRQRMRSAESKEQFEAVLRAAQRETDRAARDYMAQAEEPPPIEQPPDDLLVDQVAAWCLDELEVANRFFKWALEDRQALAAAMGTDINAIPAAWDPRAMKSSGSRRKRRVQPDG